MAHEARRRFWRLTRIYFRRFRITVLLGCLTLLAVAVYLELHGLPGFCKRPLVDQLRARGLELDFSRLRLRWFRGLVADQVTFGQPRAPLSPRLSAQEVELDFNVRALARLQMQVVSLRLRDGRLEWPIADPNAPDRALVVEDIHATLRLLAGDEWALDDLRARFAGGHFFLSGSVTNASALRQWRFASAMSSADRGALPNRLRALADTLDGISFSLPPEIRLALEGDARDANSFQAFLSVQAADALTPWGRFTNGVLIARLFPATSQERSHAELHLHADRGFTPWAEADGFALALRAAYPMTTTNLVDGHLTVSARRAETKWAVATNAEFTTQWRHSLTNPIPLSGWGQARAAGVSTPWATANNVRLTATLQTAAQPPPDDASWAGWTNIQPYELTWEGELSALQSEMLVAETIRGGGHWLAPHLLLTNLQVALHGGVLEARANVDVATRAASVDLDSHFDVQKLGVLLGKQATAWLGRFSYTAPPHLRGSAALTLPPWTQLQTNWHREVLPTLRLAGELAVTNGAFRGVAADWATSHITFTNLTWHLPDLHVGRPEGQVRIEHRAREDTRDFYYHIRSTVDPQAARPLFSTNAQRGLDYFVLTQPPVIDCEFWGRGNEDERLGLQADVALTNFTFRGETVDAVVAALRYTNQLLTVAEPRLWRGTQALSAGGIRVDFQEARIYFTNGFSTAEPQVVARAIGPKIGQTMSPYRFIQPPQVRVEGYAPLRGDEDADLKFDVEGGPFEWWRLQVPEIKGQVRWMGQTLILTNVQAGIYWGEAAGHAFFDFANPRPGTDFRFDVTVTNANLPMLMAGLFHRTNQLEGWLNGRWIVRDANSEDEHLWQGSGHVRLRDGLIWEIPIFGVLSRPLDSVMPGLGSSRLTEGHGQFTLREGLIHSDTLEMRAPTMRLQYNGTVDLDGHVNARVEAELLRDTWLIGKVVSLALWPVSKLFEYKITGTLNEPKAEPLYVPAKLIFLPLQPFRVLEGLFPGEPARTNPPPVFHEPKP